MLDVDNLDTNLMLARGIYSTVRASHEEAKKQLQILCGGLSATSAQVLRAMQPDNDGAPDMAHVAALLDACRSAVEKIDRCANDIRELAEQRAALKPVAWPK